MAWAGEESPLSLTEETAHDEMRAVNSWAAQRVESVHFEVMSTGLTDKETIDPDLVLCHEDSLLVSVQRREAHQSAKKRKKKGGEEQTMRPSFAGEMDLVSKHLNLEVEHEIKLRLNKRRMVRIFFYHLLYPFSIPLAIFGEGYAMTHSMQFIPWMTDDRKCNKRFCKPQSLEMFVSQCIVHPTVTTMFVLFLILRFTGSTVPSLPCASIVKTQILMALGFHFVRLIMIGLKYGMLPTMEYYLMRQYPFKNTRNLWMRQHLGWWGSPWDLDPTSATDGLKDEVQLCILREGIDSPSEREKRFSDQEGFFFSFKLDIRTIDLQESPLLKSALIHDNDVAQSSIYEISSCPVGAVPPVVEEKISEIYHAYTLKGNRSSELYASFRRAFALVVPKPSGKTLRKKGEINCELRWSGRDVVAGAVYREFWPSYHKYVDKACTFFACCQAMVPWFIVLYASKDAGESSTLERASDLMQKFYSSVVGGKGRFSRHSEGLNDTNIPTRWTCENYYAGNFSDYPVFQQMRWSVGEDPVWQMVSVVMTIMSTFMIFFYTNVLFVWLSHCVADYRRRYLSAYALDMLLQNQYTLVKEEYQDTDVHIGLRAKMKPPILLLDSPANVKAFVNARKILKKVGVAFHYRAQVLIALIGGIILIGVVYVLVSMINNACFVEQQSALLGSIITLFVITSVFLIEAIHQGGLANYQQSRCLSFLTTQQTFLAKQFETDIENETVEMAITSLEAAQASLETEYLRQPVKIFGVAAGAVVFRAFASVFSIIISVFAARLSDIFQGESVC